MKTSPTVRRVARSLDLDLLTSLLTRVEADLHAAADPTPVALGLLRVDDDGVDLAMRALDADDPVTSLYGTTCPPEWAAFGVVVPGRAHHLERLDGAVEPVRVGLVVSRGGEHASLVRFGDEPPEGAGGITSEGRLPDACRRALGLSTPAPEGWSGWLWALMWVEGLLVESLADPGSLSWDAAIRAHPAVDHVLRLDPAIASELPHRFVEMVEIISRRFGWDRLRALACEGALTGFGISPEIASWMDDGMFSREVMGVFPPIDSLLIDLEPVARADVVDGVDEALAAWAVL